VSDIDIAWATGVFEGEGCIALNAEKTPALQVSMCDEDVIRKFESVFGGYVTGPTHRKGCTPIYHWRLYGVKRVQAVLRLMWPLLGKRRQARAAEVIALYYEAPIKRKRGVGDREAGIPPPNLQHKWQRYRARKEGFDVPKQKPGPKPRTRPQNGSAPG
jgi:hypothetical protein